MGAFATVADAEIRWRKLTDEEQARAIVLLEDISDNLRQEAKNEGKDLDAEIASGKLLESVARSVTVDILSRMMRASTTDEPMTQASQSALGYQFQGTYLTPGGGFFLKTEERARLGLRRQKVGGIDLCP